MRRVPLSGLAVALAAGLIVMAVVFAVGGGPQLAKASHGAVNVHVHDDYFHPTVNFTVGAGHSNAIAMCMKPQPDTSCTAVVHAVAGDSITWIAPAPLAANPHTVTECTDNTFSVCGPAVSAANPIGDSGVRAPPNPGPSGWPYGPITFPTPGFYYYRCEVHPSSMRGVVQVIANEGQPGGGGVGGIAGLLESGQAADGPQDAQAGDGGSVSLALLAAFGAMAVVVSAAGATYAWKRVRREE